MRKDPSPGLFFFKKSFFPYNIFAVLYKKYSVNKKWFTMVELIIVICLISIMAIYGFPFARSLLSVSPSDYTNTAVSRFDDLRLKAMLWVEFPNSASGATYISLQCVPGSDSPAVYSCIDSSSCTRIAFPRPRDASSSFLWNSDSSATVQSCSVLTSTGWSQSNWEVRISTIFPPGKLSSFTMSGVTVSSTKASIKVWESIGDYIPFLF